MKITKDIIEFHGLKPEEYSQIKLLSEEELKDIINNKIFMELYFRKSLI